MSNIDELRQVGRTIKYALDRKGEGYVEHR